SSYECGEAQDEVNKANEAIDSADKLFHLRRALRLCPNNSSYHTMLGDLYLKLGRKEDADFEFGEARRLGL
ncbi:MAG: tetratricopeptide repeat protein, partial [SAR324 cluster bacterium]|nr:tetratricopeptide repeat protein [SAR324 cluster bacterium]